MTTYIYREGSPINYVAYDDRTYDNGLIASDDGVEWRAKWTSRYHEVLKDLEIVQPAAPGSRRLMVAPGYGGVKRANSVPAKLLPLLKWAKRSVNAQNPTAVTKSKTDADVRIVNASMGQVQVIGWKSVGRKSAHAFEAIAQMLVKACDAAQAAWNWSPVGLQVSFHTGGRAMGLAYNPGGGVRRISLNVVGLTDYTIDSLYRTTVHELCHHAREELHRRDRGRFVDAHDATFCDMLALVDPTILADKMRCRYFIEEKDASALAASGEKQNIVYSAEAGEIEIGTNARNAFRFRWTPTGSQRWRTKWETLNVTSLKGLLLLFPPHQRRSITANITRRMGPPIRKTIYEFVEQMRLLRDLNEVFV
jgi:hypothetical protein